MPRIWTAAQTASAATSDPGPEGHAGVLAGGVPSLAAGPEQAPSNRLRASGGALPGEDDAHVDDAFDGAREPGEERCERPVAEFAFASGGLA